MTGYTRITVPMSKEEFFALQRIASKEYRHPRDHARYLLRMALGLTQQEPTNDKSANTLTGAGALAINS